MHRFLRLSAIPHMLGCLLVLSILTLLAGCAHSSSSSGNEAPEEDDLFSDVDDGDRETVLIEPAEDAGAAFDVRPAVFDTALIRINAQGSPGAIVEVLVKGSFPDGCSELHHLDQEPVQGGQRVALTMRRPSTAICTQAVRPYRFFFTLDRRFVSGRYNLVINERAFPFEVD